MCVEAGFSQIQSHMRKYPKSGYVTKIAQVAILAYNCFER